MASVLLASAGIEDSCFEQLLADLPSDELRSGAAQTSLVTTPDGVVVS